MPHHDENDSTPLNNPRGGLSLGERLDKIEDTQREILAAINGLPLRVRALEVVVYGGCGFALIGILGALVTLVVKH